MIVQFYKDLRTTRTNDAAWLKQGAGMRVSTFSGMGMVE
jgi:hypothetical protein